jgi:hypothetical protein
MVFVKPLNSKKEIKWILTLCRLNLGPQNDTVYAYEALKTSHRHRGNKDVKPDLNIQRNFDENR